jgi:hypothetical protein
MKMKYDLLFLLVALYTNFPMIVFLGGNDDLQVKRRA